MQPVPQSKVTKSLVESRTGHRAAVIWMTGFSGAGKSTIAFEAELILFEKGYQVCVIDGDILRERLSSDLGFTPEDRKESIRRAAAIAQLFYEKGLVVICSLISPFTNDRNAARKLFPEGDFFEIFIDCSIEECIRRDPKGLYKKAIANLLPDFTGISSCYEKPQDPTLTIDPENTNIQQAVAEIEALLHRSFNIA